jgi:hypothetical protein
MKFLKLFLKRDYIGLSCSLSFMGVLKRELNVQWFVFCLFPTADLSQVWPEANQHFSKEIDDEANSYFQRIYNHPPHPTMSVDEVGVYNS